VIRRFARPYAHALLKVAGGTEEAVAVRDQLRVLRKPTGDQRGDVTRQRFNKSWHGGSCSHSRVHTYYNYLKCTRTHKQCRKFCTLLITIFPKKITPDS
jgi:hypothetical protein